MTKRRRSRWTTFGWTVVIPLAMACSLLSRLPAFKDGCYLGTAKAWVDGNENGERDPGEQPLPGVRFMISDERGRDNYLDHPISDEKGEFFLSIFPQTCQSLEAFDLVIQATPPEGYRATTPDRISIPKEETLDSEMHDYSFGFVR